MRQATGDGGPEVNYFGGVGLRPADGGTHRYDNVGIEHFAVEVDRQEEVDETHARCLASRASVHFPPEEDRDLPGYYALSYSTPMGSGRSVLLAALANPTASTDGNIGRRKLRRLWKPGADRNDG